MMQFNRLRSDEETGGKLFGKIKETRVSNITVHFLFFRNLHAVITKQIILIR